MLVKQGLEEKAELFEQQGCLFSFLYHLEDYANYFFGHHVPSTGYLTTFNISPYYDGILLQVPKPKQFNEVHEIKKQDKLFGIFKEHKKRVDILDIPTLSNLNYYVSKGKAEI